MHLLHQGGAEAASLSPGNPQFAASPAPLRRRGNVGVALPRLTTEPTARSEVRAELFYHTNQETKEFDN